MYFFCSTLKHQFNTDIIHENGTCSSNAVSVSSRNLMLFWYYQISSSNIILKKLLNSGFFCVQCRGYKNYCKVVKGVRKIFVQFRALW